MQALYGIINDLENAAFTYDLNSFRQKMDELIKEISLFAERITREDTVVLNRILNLVNSGLTNNDYLLVSDVLVYELVPFIKKIGQ